MARQGLSYTHFFFPQRNVATGNLFRIGVGLILSYLHRIGWEANKNQPDIVTTLLPHPRVLLITVFSMHSITKHAIGSYLLKQTRESKLKGYCFVAKLLLMNAIETAKMDILSAHLLSITYDICQRDMPAEASQAMDRVLQYAPNHSRALFGLGRYSLQT
jgi:hypothetical protein